MSSGSLVDSAHGLQNSKARHSFGTSPISPRDISWRKTQLKQQPGIHLACALQDMRRLRVRQSIADYLRLLKMYEENHATWIAIIIYV